MPARRRSFARTRRVAGVLAKTVLTLGVMVAFAGVWRVAGDHPDLSGVLHGGGAIAIALMLYNGVRGVTRAPVLSAFGLGALILVAYSIVGDYVFPQIANTFWFMFGIIASAVCFRWGEVSKNMS